MSGRAATYEVLGMAARQACTGAPNLRGKARLGAWLHARRALVPRTCGGRRDGGVGARQAGTGAPNLRGGAGRRSGGGRTLDALASVLRTHEVTNPPPPPVNRMRDRKGKQGVVRGHLEGRRIVK